MFSSNFVCQQDSLPRDRAPLAGESVAVKGVVGYLSKVFTGPALKKLQNR